jgi:PhnB protein
MRDDELDRVGDLRPDQVQPHDPAEPTVFTRHKEQLMSSINPTDLQAHLDAQHQMPDVYPRLAYNDERTAVEYLERVFGLAEIREARADFGDSMLAWLRVGSGVVMVGHANEEIHQISSPEQVGRTTVQIMVHVHDVDSHFENAVAQGAHVTMPLQDAFYGERRYEATDLEGHRWHFGETFASITARGGQVPENPTGGIPAAD